MVTFHVMGYHEIEKLSSLGRIRKLLNLAKDNKIILLQGRLRPDEEKELIKATMEEINKEFKGIELAVIDPRDRVKDGLQKFKYDMMGLVLGMQTGITIIGSANVVKKIKRDPSKIELLTKDVKKKKKK
ncbi:MAG: DUF2073 domain-containing protein [Candidatus Woesearchaeota archaeon]|jgi:hypothetical protein|nr:DUF2073 domain-containing protein [Candidatus Woesearchaeota archaeon]MDP7180956.1 DUF2073 domain-containing protein [Candidatus Woesearchaeota archaeon]MDP7198423.1 DUF2073 domain-containing protein [Candidatus Woesearchaeota archaeon]MDP7467524.1 DUF2073 domain-containing protein [Candidatus Woesearchaeota archaeon]MDP7646559.1 DUF2073 domain-containing protein [Candidatus Woesearchaeota archaeon]|tara:strand:+ start:368 stop:754 length:387 start_codon:yes stop_codon:yes gene_type:complete